MAPTLGIMEGRHSLTPHLVLKGLVAVQASPAMKLLLFPEARVPTVEFLIVRLQEAGRRALSSRRRISTTSVTRTRETPMAKTKTEGSKQGPTIHQDGKFADSEEFD